VKYRHLRRTIIASLALIAAALVASTLLMLVLHSRPVQQWTVAWVESKASDRGVELEIEELEWLLVPPRIELRGVMAERDALHAEIERLSVNLDQIRLLRPTVELGSVAVDGVSLHFTGLPEGSERTRSPLRIEVRQLDVRGLRVEGTELPGTFEKLTLSGVAAGWSVDRGGQRGFVRIDETRVELRKVEPIVVAVRARFEVEDDLQIPSWTVTGEGVSLRGEGVVDPGGIIALTGQGWLQLEELDRVVRAKNHLQGRCALALTLASNQEDYLKARVWSPQVTAANFTIRQLQGEVHVSRERLHGVLEHGFLHDGVLSGEYTLGARLRKPFPHHVKLRGRRITLASLLVNLGVPAAGLSAVTDVEAEIAWQGRKINRGRGRGSARLRPADGRLPVAGDLELRLTPEGLLRFATEDLLIGSSTLQWQGPLTIGTWVPAWSIRANPASLGELIPMVNTWIGSPAIPEELDGSGELQVNLTGPWRQLQAAIRLEGNHLTYPPMMFDRVLFEGTVRNQALDVNPLRYRIGDGSGEIEGRLGWDRSNPERQLDLTFQGQGMPLDQLAQWVGIEDGVSGTVAFTGGLRGPFRSPRGSWALALGGMTVVGQPLGNGSATVDLAKGIFSARGLAFAKGLQGAVLWDLADDRITAELSWPQMPLTPLGEQVVRLLGDQAAAQMQLQWAAGGPLLGEARATTENAGFELSAGPDALSVIATLQEAAVVSVDLQRSTDGAMSGRGKVELLAADKLLSRLLPAAGVPLTGQGQVDIEVDWPAAAWPRLSGRAEVLDLSLARQPVKLLAPATFTLSEHGLELALLHLSLLGDEVKVSGGIATEGTLYGNLSGTVDALLLRFLVPGWEPAGQVSGEIELLGSVEHPQLRGVAEIANGSFRLPGSREVVSNLDGTLLLTPDEVRPDGITFRILHGSGRCSGRISKHDGQIELMLRGSVSDLEYQLLPGLTPSLRGDWSLEGPVDQLVLSGDLEVERAVLRRKDDLATLLVDWFTIERPTTGKGLGLDLRLEADRTIEARSPFLSLNGSASLVVTGSTHQPGLLGTVELLAGGDFTFQGVRYELERGSITFSDPTRIDPFIEIQSRAWVQSYQVTVRLSGNPDRLVPVLSSDPPLTESEIIALLALGSPGEAVAGGAMGVGLASTVLTRQINAEIERRARSLLPVDQVRVDPFAEYSTGNPAARVTMVKQLSPSWTIIVQSNLSSNREEVIISRWFLGPGVFVEATRDVDGSYGIDLKLRRRY
jgi:hypothetical protein